ncbi:MAG: 3-hydroxyacyl-CoA dehydrogenase family protein [Rhodococcus sp.]|nr:3-hydroxyacyl-CoA dehydrogenase family protein [Rhodococcus sp. (in: high G+C Gram-positive bacteria)]
MSAQHVGVVGAGTMGTGVAQCLAQSGYRVTVVDSDPDALGRASKNLSDALRLAILLGRSRGDPQSVLARVHWTDRLDDLADATFVVECVRERLGQKEELFGALDRVLPAAATIASCTSAIPIDRLASATNRPGDVVGLHFMNPAPLKEAVEVVRGPRTSERTLDAALTLVSALGKEGLVVGDGPGFVLNRVLMLCIAEAATTLGSGIADAETIDALFERCLGHAMGPLRTADLIGLDNVRDTLNVLEELTGDSGYRVPDSLTALVAAGHLGRKSGEGFHDYG